MIEVLLISPLLSPSDNRFGGDHGYTHSLLDHPPSGVRYVHYESLINSGKGKQIKSIQSLVYRLGRIGVIPPGIWFESFDTRFIPDLVHIIAFTVLVRLPKTESKPPVVVGTSTGATSDLRYYYNWSEKRVRKARMVQRLLVRALGAYETSLNPQDAKRIHVWSEYSKRLHLEEGYAPPAKLEVLPPGLVPRSRDSIRHGSKPVRFLFVGRDFERKNGPLVLEAFRRVRTNNSETELVIVGQPRDGCDLSEDGVVHYQFIPRNKLLDDIMPSADVLVLPSRAEGFGLVLLEAMANGLAVIGVNDFAMPEIVESGRNGFLIAPGSLNELANCMHLYASNPQMLAEAKCYGSKLLSERFSVEAHNTKLLAIYEDALIGSR